MMIATLVTDRFPLNEVQLTRMGTRASGQEWFLEWSFYARRWGRAEVRYKVYRSLTPYHRSFNGLKFVPKDTRSFVWLSVFFVMSDAMHRQANVLMEAVAGLAKH